jgi:hypothetical protein
VLCVHCRYGNLVLAVEVISSTATIGYAILLIKQSKPKPSLGLPVADPNIPLHPDDVMFNLRVLVPCYKEKVSVSSTNPSQIDQLGTLHELKITVICYLKAAAVVTTGALLR